MNSLDNAEIVVLWSGGLDSTVLLHYILNNPEKYGGYKVAGVSLTPNFIPQDKSMNEELARERYMKEFIDKRDIINFNHVNINTENHPLTISPNNTGGVQLAYWISTLYPYLADGATLMVSIIKGDDQITFISEVNDLLNTLGKFYNKKVKICYPLMHLNKEDMIVLGADYNILEYTWSCEDGGYHKDNSKVIRKPCKQCLSCYQQMSGLVQAASHPNINPLIHEYALSQFNMYTSNVIEGMVDYPDYRRDEITWFIENKLEKSGIKFKPRKDDKKVELIEKGLAIELVSNNL